MYRSQWSFILIESLGFQATYERVLGFTAWAAAENTAAENNLLATTFGVFGSTDFNSSNVKNFASFGDGIAATILTINNGLYKSILDAIDSNSSTNIANAIDASVWGTKNVIGVLGNSIAELDIVYNNIVMDWIPTLVSTSVPTQAPIPTPTHINVDYTVVPGDTLSAIANKFKVDLQNLINSNLAKLDETARQHGLANSADGKWIWPGEVIVIP